ncbi:MAG: hypothetical protein V7K21_27685 [Nostoc sp.]
MPFGILAQSDRAKQKYWQKLWVELMLSNTQSKETVPLFGFLNES